MRVTVLISVLLVSLLFIIHKKNNEIIELQKELTLVKDAVQNCRSVVSSLSLQKEQADKIVADTNEALLQQRKRYNAVVKKNTLVAMPQGCNNSVQFLREEAKNVVWE